MLGGAEVEVAAKPLKFMRLACPDHTIGIMNNIKSPLDDLEI